MLQLLIETVTISSVVGLICGVGASVHQRSLKLGVWVWAGAVLACLGAVFGLVALLELVVRTRGLEASRLAASDNSWVFPKQDDFVVALVILIPIALIGAVLGGVVYQIWRDRR